MARTKSENLKVAKSGTPVSRVGLGCMGLSWAYTDPTQTRDDRLAFLRDAVNAGVNMFDTSDQYGPFTNEELVGKALEGVREQIFLATKGGLVVNERSMSSRDGSPEHLREAFDASLKRLRTDWVDLYQLHRVDPSVPLERSWETLAEFAQAGRARGIGLSEVSVEEIQRAQAIYPVTSVQTELSLWSRDALREVVPYCEEQGITFIAYSPLGRGFLGGGITSQKDLSEGDWRRRTPRFQEDTLAANNESILAPLRECAAELDATPAQVAIAWVLAAGKHVIAIPGTQRLRYLQQNLAAANLTIPEAWLERFARLPAAAGERY